MIAIGLFYGRGYFRQRIDTNGWQQEYWLTNDAHGLPMGRVTGPDGAPLKLSVDLYGASMAFQVWRVDVGRVPLLLLDSDLPENDPVQRWTTARLYDGSRAVRLAQYGLLGIGGARVLDALGIEPAVVHLNEGHAALAPLELAALQVAGGTSVGEAFEQARERVVFTTHTPVAAGNETYSAAQFLAAFGELPGRLGIGEDEFLDLCRVHPGDGGDPGMTALALRMSRQRNGVSRLHGEVARRIWLPLFGVAEPVDVPITHVTNGAHAATFTAEPFRRLYDRYVGEDWLQLVADPAAWEAVRTIPNEELWAARQEARGALIEYVRAKSQQDRLQRGEPIEYVRAVGDALRSDALTLGFARRIATYKRLHLLLHDPDRLSRLLTRDPPVQLLIAGKAHPSDNAGKETLQQAYRLKREREDVAERMIFVEDYDLDVARQLVAACDVWVNLPRKPMEASGTSGMKAAFNGVLQMSVLDGWWAEAHDGSNGWAVPGEEGGDESARDARDAGRFYDLLEREVIPLFHDRDAADVPQGWCNRVKHSILTCVPVFNTTRMLNDYVERVYVSD
jgi:starch phosphorylase